MSSSSSVRSSRFGRPGSIRISKLGNAADADSGSTLLPLEESQRLLKLRKLQEMEDDAVSVSTMQSAKSSMSTRSRLFGRRREETAPGASAAKPAPKTTSQNSTAEAKPKRSVRLFTFQWGKGNRSSRKQASDQLVFDFFDVQSVTSAPELVRNKTVNIQMSSLHRGASQSNLETRSVSSVNSATSASSFLKTLVIRRKARDSGEVDIDDDELTLGSGLNSMRHDGEDDDSTIASGPLGLDSTDLDLDDEISLHSSANESKASASSKGQKRKALLSRIFRRKETNAGKETQQVPEIATTETVSSDSPSPDEQALHDELEELVQLAEASTSTPIQGDELMSVNTPARPPSTGSVDRWSPIPQPMSKDLMAPRAPRRPNRRGSGYADETIPECGPGEVKEDADDDSAVSLLSNLLAAWAAERDAETRRMRGPYPRRSCLKGSTGSSPSSDRSGLSVSFSRIAIRQYERTVGDNPACSCGPPITIGWLFLSVADYDINEYEQVKPPPRTKRALRLPPGLRNEILIQDWGCTEDEIRKARREATYIQYCREKAAYSGLRDPREAAALRKPANNKVQKQQTQFAQAQVSSSSQGSKGRVGVDAPIATPKRSPTGPSPAGKPRNQGVDAPLNTPARQVSVDSKRLTRAAQFAGAPQPLSTLSSPNTSLNRWPEQHPESDLGALPLSSSASVSSHASDRNASRPQRKVSIQNDFASPDRANAPRPQRKTSLDEE